ncbi:aminotransferase class I/II-fold pyridoxal phosphate-dependent enzyme [Streptomyces aidingensis]|uniref:8-amino-7-oxononanoate synthase n=1 Tax=Streptomyces aidingensis TaxID=910347 RepID=A0A1I1JCQ1_9ACTN|nr:pyridoxal phosphate-dependent aminotransferase family protein [Streptomyces aidingensis]SFC43210.1 8-amino-7-oxononanoate synthase [Streptomyces aidingensis]
MDLFERLAGAYDEAHRLKDAGRYPYFPELAAGPGGDGSTARYGGRELIMCGSNNYLGLTGDPRVVAAARAALAEYGTSCTGSRLLNGNLALHGELEAELAAFCGKPAALVFPTGYQTNLGVLSGLLTPRDQVVIDEEVHASVIDGCRLSGARMRRFRHNDAGHLRQLLAGLPGLPEEAGRLVVVDGVYSMGGDLCELPAVARACREHGARLLVDDAHGLGVLGEGGRGTAAHFGPAVAAQADLITVTFSKSLASTGGAVLGGTEVIHWLRHVSRALIFSAGPAPAATAAALAALRVLRAEPERAARARENAARVRRELAGLGVDCGTGPAPIVPLHTPDVPRTIDVWNRLLERGVYLNPVVPPAASPRLRASFLATHTGEQVARAVEALAPEAPLLRGCARRRPRG